VRVRRGESDRAESSLPASSFSENIDDMAKAFGTLEPVLLQPHLHAVGIAGFNGTDDSVVLFDGKMEILNDGAGIETPVTLGLGLYRSMEGREPRSCAALNDKPMKFAVEFKNLAGMSLSLSDI
jgi:hypothetical protein